MAQLRAPTTPATSVPAVAGVAALAVGGWVVTACRLAGATRALRAERTDPVTGLPTRRAWTTQTAPAVAAPRGELWLLLADVDDLKPINDSLGHDAGHAVLAATADRMRTALHGRLSPGRLGGDEFGLLLRHPQRGDLAQLDTALCAPVTVPADGTTTQVPVSVSIGAVPVPADGADLGALLAQADSGMYRAKTLRRTRGRRSAPVEQAPGQTGELVPDSAPRYGGVACRADTARHPAHRASLR